MSQHRPARAAVFSAGSWGTALAKIMADAGTDVTMHARRSEIADAITTAHRNPGYFPDIELPRTITATTDPTVALGGADFLVLSIPAQSLRANLAAWAPHIGPETLIVSLMKGIERGSKLRASQVITEVTGVSADRVAVLSGPNLAPEIMVGQPAAATIACPDEDAAHRFQQACRTLYFRPYTSTDVIGCELGGAVKNVIALAVGISSSMGLGDNAAVPCSSLADWPRPPDWPWPWAPPRPPSPDCPAWATWWQAPPPPSPATAPSASTWAGA